MNKLTFVILSVMVCVATGVSIPPVLGQSKTDAAPSAWTADSAMLPQLDEETPLSGFVIRPPKGYKMMNTDGPEGVKPFVWKGAERADGSSPFVMALIMAAPPGETNMPPAELVLKKHIAGVEQRRTDWQQSTIEAGQINGMPFVRAQWSGVDKVKEKKMHGFIYVMVSGTRIIQLSSQDVEPQAEQALRLAESSVLTIRRK